MDEGDIPQEVPRSEDYRGEQENILRGYKATISNPRTALATVPILRRPALVIISPRCR
jgi:hypothetical protein